MLINGSACCNKKLCMAKISAVEIRMFRWMWSKTKKDKLNNEYIREMVEVAFIEDKIRGIIGLDNFYIYNEEKRMHLLYW